MKDFAALFSALDSTTSTKKKTDALLAYFQRAQPADAAWAQLKRAIIWPRGADVEALTVAHRSRDFGRTDAVVQFAEERGRLASVRDSLWREGQIAQTFPLARPILLAALEGVYAGRDAIATLKRRLRRR